MRIIVARRPSHVGMESSNQQRGWQVAKDVPIHVMMATIMGDIHGEDLVTLHYIDIESVVTRATYRATPHYPRARSRRSPPGPGNHSHLMVHGALRFSIVYTVPHPHQTLDFSVRH